MKQTLFYIATLLTLLCCSSHPGEVIIRGRFAHLEQGEFYIYASDGGRGTLDTLRIADGKFSYSMPLEETAIMHILYPNYSELTVFAEGGKDIKVEGDAQNLSEVEVSGSEDNVLYTAFRKETAQKSAAEIRELARQYALEHPTLTLSRYLLSQYFLFNDSVRSDEVKEVYDSLCRACPQDIELTRLASAVRSHGLLGTGKLLPDFSLKMRKSLFREGAEEAVKKRSDFKGNYLLISFWAGWKSGSQSALYRTRRTIRDMKEKGLKLDAISYSLDVNESSLRTLERRDSIDYNSYCDFKCMESPLVREWGIRDLPYFVFVGPDMKIIASGSDWARDIEQHVSAIKH